MSGKKQKAGAELATMNKKKLKSADVSVGRRRQRQGGQRRLDGAGLIICV